MHIAIVGGGTSGWLSAAYLKYKLPFTTVSVIDKEFGEPIGVGEGTVLDFKPFLEDCGFPIEEWLPATGASFKAGIHFPNWKKKGSSIWHPFFINYRDVDLGANIWDYWAYVQEGKDYKDYSTMMYDVSKENRVDIEDLGSYAYHVDAGLLVKYIQEKIQNATQIIKSEVVNVNRNESGHITSLDLKNNTQVFADIFVDCTGFASVLKEQKRVDITDRLFCDTAVAGRVMYKDKAEEMTPYVTCDAVDHGWIWRIPVQERMGSGLVFNRSITDIEEAKDYLVNYWNGRLDRDALKVIDWTPYYISNFWETNCVSIGLSGGFIEPLESTGISIIIKGIELLEERLRVGYWEQGDVILYNNMMTHYYENTIDFVNMHYAESERTEPFWMFVRDKFKKSKYQDFMERIMSQPELRRNRIEGQNSITMFHPASWFCLMIQYGFDFNADPKDFIANIAEHVIADFYRVEQARKNRSVEHHRYIDYLVNGR